MKNGVVGWLANSTRDTLTIHVFCDVKSPQHHNGLLTEETTRRFILRVPGMRYPACASAGVAVMSVALMKESDAHRLFTPKTLPQPPKRSFSQP